MKAKVPNVHPKKKKKTQYSPEKDKEREREKNNLLTSVNRITSWLRYEMNCSVILFFM